jgi:hypothetical protein
VQNVTTDANGVVTATAWNISPDDNGKRLILAPFVGAAPADAATMMGQSISEWRCGAAPVNGVSLRHLPAGCRGS